MKSTATRYKQINLAEFSNAYLARFGKVRNPSLPTATDVLIVDLNGGPGCYLERNEAGRPDPFPSGAIIMGRAILGLGIRAKMICFEQNKECAQQLQSAVNSARLSKFTKVHHTTNEFAWQYIKEMRDRGEIQASTRVLAYHDPCGTLDIDILESIARIVPRTSLDLLLNVPTGLYKRFYGQGKRQNNEEKKKRYSLTELMKNPVLGKPNWYISDTHGARARIRATSLQWRFLFATDSVLTNGETIKLVTHNGVNLPLFYHHDSVRGNLLFNNSPSDNKVANVAPLVVPELVYK